MVLYIINVEHAHGAAHLEVIRQRLSINLQHLRAVPVLLRGARVAEHVLRGAHLHAELLSLQFLVGRHVGDRVGHQGFIGV